MSKCCIILGSGKAAVEAARALEKATSENSIAAWQSAIDTHAGLVTIGKGIQLGTKLSSVIDCLKRNEVSKICAIGAFNADIDRGQPDAELAEQMVGGLNLSPQLWLRHTRDKFKKAKISPVPISSVLPQFQPLQDCHPASNDDLKNYVDLQGRLEVQRSWHIPDSAIYVSGKLELMQGEDGMDKMLGKCATKATGLKEPATLIKAALDGLGDLTSPTIGPDTVRRCNVANISRIVVPRRCVVIAERKNFYDEIESSNIELVLVDR